MRIVHYIPRIDLAEGGVVRAVLDTCTLTREAGYSVTLITRDAKDAPDSLRDSLVVLSGKPALLSRLSGPDLAVASRAIAESDAVHLHTPWDPANVQLARAASRSGKPYVVSIHGMLDDWSMAQSAPKKRLYLALAGRNLLEGAAFVHCTAEGERAQSARWYPRGRARVVPLVMDLAEYMTLPDAGIAHARFAGVDWSKPVVLFLSRIHHKKGIEVLIDACAELARRGAAHSLVVAGTGDEAYTRSLVDRALERGIGDRAHFVGLVTGVEKISLYRAATVFALPTSQENFGLVLPEALACGTPVVTTKGVDIWPELESSGGALIADPATPEQFAQHIGALLGTRARRDEMGAKGREWVLSSLSAESVMGLYVEMYREAITRGS